MFASFQSPDDFPGSRRRHREKPIFNFSVMPQNGMESQYSWDISIITEEARNTPAFGGKTRTLKDDSKLNLARK